MRSDFSRQRERQNEKKGGIGRLLYWNFLVCEIHVDALALLVCTCGVEVDESADDEAHDCDFVTDCVGGKDIVSGTDEPCRLGR